MSRTSNIHDQTSDYIDNCTKRLLANLKSIALSKNTSERKKELVKKNIEQAFSDFGGSLCSRQIDECAIQATSADLKAGSMVSKHSVNMVYKELPF